MENIKYFKDIIKSIHDLKKNSFINIFNSK